jgi:hypothetical protein
MQISNERISADPGVGQPSMMGAHGSSGSALHLSATNHIGELVPKV